MLWVYVLIPCAPHHCPLKLSPNYNTLSFFPLIRFGPGPHKVEMELEYPKVSTTNSDPATWPRVRNKLSIELAPLDLMPHTVNLFLQQVHHKLWDGCSVNTNADHIYQLGPSYEDDLKEKYSHYEQFYERGLDKVSYQEYSEQYRHKQWTVGLAGRPGGPDFYVNKVDNTVIHGPGGQTNDGDMHNEADPCFGRVADDDSRRVLDEIGMIPTDAENGYAIKYPVVIVSARVWTPKENPVDGWRVIEPGTRLSQGEGDDEIMPLPDVPHGI